MDYKRISADCHIDLCWLPHDLFVKNSCPELRDRMPYVEEGPNGLYWRTKSGLDLGLANGLGSGGTMSSGGRRYVPGIEARGDRFAETGLFDDGSKGVFRPTTPELRLKDQDLDNTQAEVLYGLLGSGMKFTDQEAAIEFYRIYNVWLSDFCSYNLKRLVGVACIPSHTVEAAVAEIDRVKGKPGIGGVELAPSWKTEPLWHPQWDPVWKASADANLPVHFHTHGIPQPPVASDLPEYAKVAASAVNLVSFQMHTGSTLAAFIYSGALERHPTLRMVLGESGIGWIPYVLERLDWEYEERYKGRSALKMKPSDYWRRQCRATFQDDRLGIKNLDDLGEENVMWASDYPHRDGVWPDSDSYIEKQFRHLPDETRSKITCENAGRFYGLIRD
jgi:predicted TIM-barrel fold metal-dependent hydrolase